MSKKMKILIFSSFLLNVLLIGVVIGDVTHRFHIEHFVRKSVKEFASKLPEDKAALFLGPSEQSGCIQSDPRNKKRSDEAFIRT